ncbi:MAG: type IV toxin-antitoxin system AbiEi family antitoxin [Spirosomataceae bacterium]
MQSIEIYAFSWEEVLKNCDSPVPTLRKELVRLTEQNEIINLRQGFYLIIPPRYQSFGKLPVQLFVNTLFDHLEKDYYVALYSAATVYGASHQRIQQDYIITTPPALRDIQKGKFKVRFLNVKNWPRNNIVEKKSDAGVYKVSSPALTAADLIRFHTKIGGLNRLLSNLEELVREITVEDMKALLDWYPNKSTLQRLGFLLDELSGKTEVSEKIYENLTKKVYHPILLTPRSGQKAGSTTNRWKVDININLEYDT